MLSNRRVSWCRLSLCWYFVESSWAVQSKPNLRPWWVYVSSFPAMWYKCNSDAVMLRRGVLKQFLSTFISLLIVSDFPRRIRFFLRIIISRWQKSIQRQFKLFKVVRNHAGNKIQRSKDHRNIVVTNFYLRKIFHLIHPQFVVTDTPKWRHFFEKSNIIGQEANRNL